MNPKSFKQFENASHRWNSRILICERQFTVFTDCNSVRTSKKAVQPRFARWWIRLQNYECDIEYQPSVNVKDATLYSSKLKQFHMKNNFVHRCLPTGLKCYVPQLAKLVITKCFHIGVGKFYAKMREMLKHSVKRYNCRTCVLSKSHTGKKRKLGRLNVKATRSIKYDISIMLGQKDILKYL